MRKFLSNNMKRVVTTLQMFNSKNSRNESEGSIVAPVKQSSTVSRAHEKYLRNVLKVSAQDSVNIEELDALFLSKKIKKDDLLDVLYKASNVVLTSDERSLYNEVLLYDQIGNKVVLKGFDKDNVILFPDRKKVIPPMNPKTRLKSSVSVGDNYIDANLITLYGDKKAVLSSAPSKYDRTYFENLRKGAGVGKIYSVRSMPTSNKKACLYDDMEYGNFPVNILRHGFHQPLRCKEKSNMVRAYKSVAQDIYDGKTIAVHCNGGKDRSALVLFAGACAALYGEIKDGLQEKSDEEIKHILYTEFLKIHMKMRIQRSPETHRYYPESIKFIHDFVEKILSERTRCIRF